MKKTIDLTGQKFGRLTVLERTEDYVSPSGRHLDRFRCECDCGATVEVLKQHLRSGRTTSCGCYYRDMIASKTANLRGKRFGRLNVIHFVGVRESNSRKQRIWSCLCDCGSFVDTDGAYLVSGKTESCGCFQREVARATLLRTASVGDDVTYAGQHTRIRRARGSASDHPCVDCGGLAEDWSCRRDADHVTDDQGRYYSLDIEDYDPRCTKCHAAYDRKAVA